MDLHTILDEFANGSLSLSEVKKVISIHAIEKIGDIAKLDVGREIRRGGMPEIIFSESKEYREERPGRSKTHAVNAGVEFGLRYFLN